MSHRIKLVITVTPEGQEDKYRSEEKWFEQTATSEWLLDNNPDYFQKVIAAFNGVEWKKNEH